MVFGSVARGEDRPDSDVDLLVDLPPDMGLLGLTYREQQRLADIQAAIDAIRSHLQRGDLSDGLVFDAVRIRLLEIGEAVKALPAEVLSSQPAIPWAQIARMRDHLAHPDEARRVYYERTDSPLWKIIQAAADVLERD